MALKMGKPDPLGEILTVAQAAHIAGITGSSVKRAIERGSLRATRVGERMLLIQRGDLDTYLDTRKGGRDRKPDRRKLAAAVAAE